MTSAELAQEFERLSKSPIFADASEHGADWHKWLKSDNPQLLPKGRKVRAEILVKCNSTGKLVDIIETNCIVIDDNVNLFGIRNVKLYDIAEDKIKYASYSLFDVKEIYPDE